MSPPKDKGPMFSDSWIGSYVVRHSGARIKPRSPLLPIYCLYQWPYMRSGTIFSGPRWEINHWYHPLGVTGVRRHWKVWVAGKPEMIENIFNYRLPHDIVFDNVIYWSICELHHEQIKRPTTLYNYSYSQNDDKSTNNRPNFPFKSKFLNLWLAAW